MYSLSLHYFSIKLLWGKPRLFILQRSSVFIFLSMFIYLISNIDVFIPSQSFSLVCIFTCRNKAIYSCSCLKCHLDVLKIVLYVYGFFFSNICKLIQKMGDSLQQKQVKLQNMMDPPSGSIVGPTDLCVLQRLSHPLCFVGLHTQSSSWQ